MPEVFIKNSKIKVIEYGDNSLEDFAFIQEIKNNIIQFSKKLLKAS